MPYLSTVVAYVVGGFVLEQVLVQQLGLLKILLYENFWMVVWTLSSFLAISVHVIPTKLANDVLILA
jgi:hypothetical protein